MADTNFSYDQSMARAEAIVQQLEQSDAISMDEYKKLAAEATSLLNQCRESL